MPEDAVLNTEQGEAQNTETTAAPAEGGVRDARVQLFADDGYMTVELLIEAPQGGGRHVSRDEIDETLRRGGVVHGVYKGALEALAAPLYGEKTVVARGTPPQDGVDGACTELFARKIEKQLAEKEDGTVDYRDIGFIRDIKEGTPLCEIAPSTKGVDGKNTRGERIKAVDGKPAVIPAGENTRLSGDGTRLESAAMGNLVYRDGRFCVEQVVRLGSVDFNTGNITFSGDVIVNGDVMDGFEVQAGGNITLRGQAGGVVLRAGGNLTIEKGMNGNGKAVLETPHTLKAGFVENCTLKVGEKLIANTLLNCQVECEGDVDASVGKGIVCGGKLEAFGSVKVRTIGNESSALTTVNMGVIPRLLGERKRLEEQVGDVQRHIANLQNNVDYIERLVKDGRPVPPERIQMLKRSQIQLPMSEKKRDQMLEGIAEIDAKMQEAKSSTLVAATIFPPTKISIGARRVNVIEKRTGCRVYIDSEGELVIGKA